MLWLHSREPDRGWRKAASVHCDCGFSSLTSPFIGGFSSVSEEGATSYRKKFPGTCSTSSKLRWSALSLYKNKSAFMKSRLAREGEFPLWQDKKHWGVLPISESGRDGMESSESTDAEVNPAVTSFFYKLFMAF